jgi:hypothetical protein
VADRAVLAGAVHTLKYQKQSIVVRRIMKLLQGAKLRHVLCQKIVIFGLRRAERFHLCLPLTKFDLLSGPNAKLLRINFHLLP